MSQSVRSLVSSGLSRVNRPVGRRRLKKAVRDTHGPLRIEIGAWRTSHSGWISTDVHWRAKYFLDATRRWPFEDESVSYIYADNVVEHLKLDKNRILLSEAYRTLMPGGRIRLVTPDIAKLVTLYLAGTDVAQPLRDELIGDGYSIHHQIDILRFAFQDDGHHEGYLWDEAALISELVRAGFIDVSHHDAGMSRDPEMSGLEIRVGTPVASICMILEAMKAESPAV